MRYQTALRSDNSGWYTLPYRAASLSPAVASARAKDRMRHPVARGDAELARGSRDDFQDATDRAARRDDARRKRLGILDNAQDSAVGADKDHVEGDVGILHPEADFLLVLEVEQHALPLGQFLPVHQTLRALGVVLGDLDRKGMHAGLAGDLKRPLVGRPRRPGGDEQADDNEGNPGEMAHDLHLGGPAPGWQ